MMIGHDEPPEIGEVPQELVRKRKQLELTPYWQRRIELKGLVKGKAVVSSEAGLSGYVLFFDDGTWIIAYLNESVLDWITGSGQPAEKERELIHSAEYGDGTLPLSADLPYADEWCDMCSELSKAHGAEVAGISIGEKTFGLVFSARHALDSWIVPTDDGRIGLRVFWEQW